MKCNLFIATIITAVMAIMSGCTAMPVTQDGHPDVYGRTQSMRTGRVVEGVVLQVRDVRVASGTTAKTLGGASGALVGMLLTKGKSMQTQTVGTVIGGLAGTVMAASATNSVGDEVVVRLEGGEKRVIVQDKGRTALQPGQKILVLVNGSESRIIGQQ